MPRKRPSDSEADSVVERAMMGAMDQRPILKGIGSYAPAKRAFSMALRTNQPSGVTSLARHKALEHAETWDETLALHQLAVEHDARPEDKRAIGQALEKLNDEE